MSGDIGRGATREAIKFALHLALVKDKPKGFVSLLLSQYRNIILRKYTDIFFIYYNET